MSGKILFYRSMVLFAAAVFLITAPSCSKKKIYSEPGASQAGLAGGKGMGSSSDAFGGGGRSGGIDEQSLRGQGGGTGGTGGIGGVGADSSYGGSGGSLVTEDIYFEFDSAVLLPEGRDILKRKADFLRANSSVSIRIEGHTDERGTPQYNIALGERRAEAARSFLESMGVPSSRMDTVSFGEERPVDPGANEAAWARNRRVHVEIIR